MRVGFVLSGRTVGWMASWTYYRTLLGAVREVGDSAVEPVVFVGERERTPLLADLGPVELHRSGLLDRPGPAAAGRLAWRYALARDRPLAGLLRGHGIDVMSHSGHLGREREPAVLGWVPDLQHLHLPHLFGRRTRAFRDARYRLLPRFASHLVTSSEAGRRDLIRIAPRAEHKTSVLRFVVEPVPRERQPDREELDRVYRLPERFLYLPNQFWVHKNHRLVIDALARVPEVTVVCTGIENDRRAPGHFASLVEHARWLGVQERFRTLGVVPYEHVAGLLRESLALVNPSLFEGWSTTVEEAKSAGKPVLLSDIPVHREQDPPGGSYFDPADVDSLAEALRAVWAREPPEELAERARQELPERRRRFVATYEQALRKALA